MMKDTITFRYRMSDRDVFYGGGVVNGARSITLMEDAAKRLMAKTFGNTGRCVEVKKVRLYTPCFAGDYMEYIAGIRKQEGNKVTDRSPFFLRLIRSTSRSSISKFY